MLTKIDKIDKKADEERKAAQDKLNKIGVFTKIHPLNRPRYFVALGIIGALINGSIQPMLGLMMAKLITVMSIPRQYLPYLG